MKLSKQLGSLTLAAFLFACGDEEATQTPDQSPVAGTLEVREAITEDTTWKADTTYVLKQHVFVDGATLTIEPGTVVLGEPGSSLVIQTTGRLVAEGQPERPIVFTSALPEAERSKGDWGGVVLLGRAPINVAGGKEQVEGISGETARTEYGGTSAAHDCGSLKYVRIEFAGFELSKDNELNGLTVAGCGSDTRLDYIQVHRGADDGVEFFGGTADIRHLVVTGAEDDGLDWDLGWTGKVQFLIVQQLSGLGNAAFESDSNGDAMESTPRSAPELWNVTLVGRPQGTASSKSMGLVLREGTAGKMRNFIVVGFGDAAVDVQDASTAAQHAQGNLLLKNTLFWDIKGSNEGIPSVKNAKKDANGTVVDEDVADFDESTALLVNEPTNRMMDPRLTAATSPNAPSFAPLAGSPALNAELADEPPAGFDSTARFVGAIGQEDWTAGWTAYPVGRAGSN